MERLQITECSIIIFIQCTKVAKRVQCCNVGKQISVGGQVISQVAVTSAFKVGQ